jgi:hypothetical protein
VSAWYQIISTEVSFKLPAKKETKKGMRVRVDLVIPLSPISKVSSIDIPFKVVLRYFCEEKKASYFCEEKASRSMIVRDNSLIVPSFETKLS